MYMSTSLEHNARSGYGHIAHRLRAEILDGSFRADQQLPSISELARRFGTTVVTVRRALARLEDEGLLRVEHGSGSFVADWSRGFDLLQLPSFSEEMSDRSIRAVTEVVGRGPRVRHAPAAIALGLEEGAPVAVLARVRRVRNIPIVFQKSYLPEAQRDLVGAYTPERSLYELLRDRAGAAPVSAEERLRPVSLPEDVAAMLEVEAGSLGWVAERVTRDAAGRPLVYDEAYFTPERVELRVRRRGAQTAIEYLVMPQEGQHE
jgi:GntR family transcriptional regulator